MSVWCQIVSVCIRSLNACCYDNDSGACRKVPSAKKNDIKDTPPDLQGLVDLFNPDVFLHCRVQACTFSPADDIIHVGRHSLPEAVVSWVTRLRADDGLRVLVAFVKPPELAVAEQVGFSVVGPDEGRLHSVHQGAAFLLHAPIGERSRVAVHGHRVLKDPIFRPLKNRGTCEGDIYFLTKKQNKKTTMYFSPLDTLQPGTFQSNLHYGSVFCDSFFFFFCSNKFVAYTVACSYFCAVLS